MKTLFLTEDSTSPYTTILGLSLIHSTTIVIFTYHQMIKIPTPEGNRDIIGDQLVV